MKIWIGALWATLGMIACVGSRDAETLATDEQEAIGACGANADPVTGVMCQYTYYLSGLEGVSGYVSSETFERDGLDYVRCTWTIPCKLSTVPKSDAGAMCVATIGTGCNEQNAPETHAIERLIPPGTPADGVDAFCKDRYPSSDERHAACSSRSHTVEQYEDQCCVVRTPSPKPVPEMPPAPE